MWYPSPLTSLAMSELTQQQERPHRQGMSLRPHLCFSAIVLLLAASVGCGGSSTKMAPVAGKVLLDGEPVTIGYVTTMPLAGPGAKGVIQPDGSFVLGTLTESDGASIGAHRVSIASYSMPVKKGPEAGP